MGDLCNGAAPDLPPASSPKPAWVKECQYIDGDKVTPDAMCKEPVKAGSAYCAEHHRLCFVPIKPRPPVPVVKNEAITALVLEIAPSDKGADC